MIEKVEAIVKPELLAWARKSSGLSLPMAAKRIGTTEERLSTWETGERRPTINQLRKMGEVYKRPIAIFYLPMPPKGFDPIKDFRRISEKRTHEYSPSLLYEIRRAYTRRESAIDLYKELDGTIPRTKLPIIDVRDDLEKAGSIIREFFHITYEKQMQWNTDRESFNGWRNAIESKGILVFQASRIPVEEMRGFSISKAPFPTIMVNIQDALVARTFTLMHELAHVLIGKEGVCDLTGHADIEVSCNALAGAILVPKKLFLAEPEFQGRKLSSIWTDDEINNLAGRYKVSRDVVLRRLLTIGSITTAFYKKKSSQYRELWIKQAQKEKREKKDKGGFAPPDRMVVSSFGKLFAQLVLNSYRQDKITISDVSDLLSVKLKYLPKIEMAVFS